MQVQTSKAKRMASAYNNVSVRAVVVIGGVTLITNLVEARKTIYKRKGGG